MDGRINGLYQIPNIAEYEDVCLQTLREQCMVLEEQLREIMEKQPDRDRQIVESYLDRLDVLEFQSIKTALRWGIISPSYVKGTFRQSPTLRN